MTFVLIFYGVTAEQLLSHDQKQTNLTTDITMVAENSANTVASEIGCCSGPILGAMLILKLSMCHRGAILFYCQCDELTADCYAYVASFT